MTIRHISGRFSYISVLFLIFSFLFIVNSYAMGNGGTDFLDECPSGLSMNGCCISEEVADTPNACNFGNGATKVNVCHNNGTINPSTNSIAGNTPGAHFVRCDWVLPGNGTDASNTTCDLGCVRDDDSIDIDCDEFRNDDANGHTSDILGECSPVGCLVNGCDDGNICTQDICNEQTGECSFPIEPNFVSCRPSTGDCDPQEMCGNGQIDSCPADNFDDSGSSCTDGPTPGQQCEINVCNDSGECILDSTDCNCTSDIDCNDGNACTQDICDQGICSNDTLEPDGTICRTASGICDEEEVCQSGECPSDDFIPAEDMLICDDDGDSCTQQFCDGIGGCELITLDEGEGECPVTSGDDDDDMPPTGGDPSEEDDILETDNGEAFQLYCYYDLRDRESFCQVTNISPDNVLLHIQVFNVGDNCNENDFNDSYTPNDTHVYDLRNILTNDGNSSGVVLPNNAYGFVVITAVAGAGQEAVEGNLIGNFRVVDESGYEYRSNAQGLDLPSDEPIETTNEYTFNFNEEGGVIFSDVVGITLDEISTNEVKATSIVDIFTKFDVSVFNNNEVIFSCRDIVFACNDQDAANLTNLLETSQSAVSSFEYGINNAFPNSKGAPLLCPGNNVTEGLVRLNLIPPFSDFDIFAGYVGLNNGNGRGSMDSFWSENFLLQPPPP